MATRRRAKFDEAQQAFVAAQAQVASSQAQVRIAQDQLSYTVVSADAPGAITAVGAEPGEVVRAGQMIVQLARTADATPSSMSPKSSFAGRAIRRRPALTPGRAHPHRPVRATGRVREVSPQADVATRTFQVKVGIINPPKEMPLGSTVTGRIKLAGPPGVQVPASALTEANGRPAVWVVDPQSQTVSLRNVEIFATTRPLS